MATATNTAIIQYAQPIGNWTTPTHYGFWTSATGGTWLGGDALTSSVVQPTTGANVNFAATALTITVPDGEFAAAGSRRAVEQGILGISVYVSLHSADPGTTGASEITGNAYARVAVASSGWTFS